jgi:hypothetical protein
MAVSVRQPPPRPFEGVRRDGRLLCPICGEAAGLRRGWWHHACAQLWNLATNPHTQLVELRRQGDCCWSCGNHHASLEVEHIRPLWSLTADERLELKWWLPFNLQLLCRACHRAKTAREARERYDAQNPDTPAVRRRRDTRRLLEDGELTLVEVSS